MVRRSLLGLRDHRTKREGVQSESYHPREVDGFRHAPLRVSRRLLEAVASAAPHCLPHAAWGREREAAPHHVVRHLLQVHLYAIRKLMVDKTAADEFSEDHLPPPTGTVFVLGMYMLALVAGWAVMFWMLVER